MKYLLIILLLLPLAMSAQKQEAPPKKPVQKVTQKPAQKSTGDTFTDTTVVVQIVKDFLIDTLYVRYKLLVFPVALQVAELKQKKDTVWHHLRYEKVRGRVRRLEGGVKDRGPAQAIYEVREKIVGGTIKRQLVKVILKPQPDRLNQLNEFIPNK